MKYNIFINQRAVIETGLYEKLDITDLALFDFIYDLMNNNRVPKTLINGVEYTQIRHSLVSEQCPILRINHRDPLRKRMLKLVDAGLLIRYERNQEENQSLYARGPRFSTLVFSNGQSGDLPLNNSTLPFDNVTPCRQSTPPPAVDERHDNNINVNSTTNNTTTSIPKKGKKGLDFSFIGIQFEEAFNKWLSYKRERGEMYKTQHGIEEAYYYLLQLAGNDPWTAIQLVNNAISKEWKGIYEIKQSKQQSYGSSSTNTTSRAQQLAAELKRQGFSFT